MGSWFDIISSLVILAIFCAAVHFARPYAHFLDPHSNATAPSKNFNNNVSYDASASRVAIKTDRVAPSRDEYIQNMQGAFKRGAHMVKGHRDAFGFKKGEAGAASPTEAAGEKSVRSKKLA
ncbi:hypothetical protein L202_01636 [Cryptococcus amylolentus CBS 6039]|uniref:Uncharacterized protein n=2 Tax=Cryptococcus amylolentus TaxID=104669 RepID=A0A1E3I4L2_9TREE|nr:hypothetical protein L202_01636 [Cryptococcus amylolentus CBS 6039]ODN83502.1 hypothetical protein L202_01636 [Cryptococcus amylolentus CBS 6039]ODO11017.1 hypothetical protein I350_01617 [Cryptococcus amylolentus CBS 6273]OXG99244.1 hypothetical protein C369_07366 [Cryptococcus neoformans var. grubii A5-35-17]OXG99904.1 hypothetical protein C370_07407 [Cryptococcus neoformans var. grubii A1-35-8]